MPELTDRQEEIIIAAIYIIAEQSAQGLSMRNIANRVGVSEPALYRHFENKDDLLQKLIFYLTNYVNNTFQWQDDSDQSALEQLEESLGNTMKFFSDSWPFTTTLYATDMFFNKPELANELQSVNKTSIARINKILLRGQRDGNINKNIRSDQMAVVIFGAVRLLIERWKMSQRSFDLVEEWDNVWEALRTMIAAPIWNADDER